MCVWGSECVGQVYLHLSCQLIGAPANYLPGCDNRTRGVPKAQHIVACINRRDAFGPKVPNCIKQNGEFDKVVGSYYN